MLFKRKHHYKRIRDDKVAAIQGDSRDNIIIQELEMIKEQLYKVMQEKTSL